MTKSEFLAQENVPEFIKEIVASIPDDADVDIEGFKLGRPPKKEGCSCDHDKRRRKRRIKETGG